MNKHIAWKLLVLVFLMAAFLCSSIAIGSEQSERTVLRNFRFAGSQFNIDDESNIQRYHYLWFWKQPALKPTLKPINFHNEISPNAAVSNFEMREPFFFRNGKLLKIIKLGQTMYIRPDLRLAHEKGSRNVGLEVGFRYLFWLFEEFADVKTAKTFKTNLKLLGRTGRSN